MAFSFATTRYMGNTYWERGQQRKVARAVNISEQNLCDILHRRRQVSVRRAYELAGVVDVPAIEWLTNRISRHPAFYGKPAKTL